MKGLILKSTGSWYEVLVEGRRINARTRGKLRLKGARTTNPVAVGDWVELEEEGENAVITDIHPRQNYIIRKSVHKREEAHMLAANIDQAMLIATFKFPRTSLGFIDRFLVTAESFRIPQVLVFNKQDLLNEKQKARQEELIRLYTSIGVTCLTSSAVADHGLDTFKETLKDKITLIAGHSGVGKSTLINTLSPELALRTGEVSTFVNKGIHTTTFAEMIVLNESTFIIDTPGIKELGLADIPPEELSDYFPEMRAISGDCKFNNCLHVHEPKCAVQEAVDKGKIAESRYLHYLGMLEGDDNRR
jgi:ribosome biogenesis GTPase